MPSCPKEWHNLNAKRAKAARRLAREHTTNLPVDGYLAVKPNKLKPQTCIIVDPATTKGVYRKIKKAIKRAYHQ